MNKAVSLALLAVIAAITASHVNLKGEEAISDQQLNTLTLKELQNLLPIEQQKKTLSEKSISFEESSGGGIFDRIGRFLSGESSERIRVTNNPKGAQEALREQLKQSMRSPLTPEDLASLERFRREDYTYGELDNITTVMAHQKALEEKHKLSEDLQKETRKVLTKKKKTAAAKTIQKKWRHYRAKK